MSFYSLKDVKEKVNHKLEIELKTKEKLIAAVNESHRIDDIHLLLDYKDKQLLPNKNWYEKIQRIYKIFAYENEINGDPINTERKQGRLKIFTEYPESIVSKFRKTGITKYRTSVVLSAEYPNRQSQSEILDRACADWRLNMLNWINSEKSRLSDDEQHVDLMKYQFSDSQNVHSEFAQSLLNELNNSNNYKMIDYEHGKINSALNNIIVVDLSEKE